MSERDFDSHDQDAREDERDPVDTGRRALIGGAAALAVTAMAPAVRAAVDNGAGSLAASPPAGFVPLSAPGKVVKVTKPGCLQENQVYPKPDDAKAMLTRALTELSGKPTVAEALAQFIHKDDRVV